MFIIMYTYQLILMLYTFPMHIDINKHNIIQYEIQLCILMLIIIIIIIILKKKKNISK